MARNGKIDVMPMTWKSACARDSELRVFRQEPVPGMNGLGTGTTRGFENHVTAQIAVLRARAANVHGFITSRDMR